MDRRGSLQTLSLWERLRAHALLPMGGSKKVTHSRKKYVTIRACVYMHPHASSGPRRVTDRCVIIGWQSAVHSCGYKKRAPSRLSLRTALLLLAKLSLC